MALLFTTAEKEAHAEQVIERSRFIAHIKPISDRAEAEEYIASIRKQYNDAAHNVPCFVIGDKMQLQWASDGGEPQGSAGPPMLQFFVREGITNICAVVTRYFGGIKLGTGGLVRAYSSSAKLALDAAGIKEVRDNIIWNLKISYNALHRLNTYPGELPFSFKVTNYAEFPTVRLSFESENQGLSEKMISDLFQGNFQKIP